MAADSGEIVEQVGRMKKDFEALVELVSGPAAMKCTAADVELRLFRQLLALGRQLLALFFSVRAAVRPAAPTGPDGVALRECRLRRTTYQSVFGKVTFNRHRFFGAGQAGVSPLDAELSLGHRCYSSLLRDWAGYELVDAVYDQTVRTLERILGLDLSKSALETLVSEDAVDVDAFYTQKPVPVAADEGPILVVQADGAGVRLVGSEPSERTGHRTSKREALVTSIYTIQRYVRTPQAMVEVLLDAGDNTARPLHIVRPAPIGKETRATLDGKEAAIARLRARVDQRDGTHIQDRVAITDGSEALQQRVATGLPGFTLVLDIMHVLTYLWPAAQALNGGWLSPACHAYVRRQLEALLAGQAQTVIEELATKADAIRLKAYQRKPVDDAIRYFTNKLPFMRYDLYLARGWPIASGVIEGACKHVVRGRLDRSGMKWAHPGAHAMLQLRAVRINDDWDDYQRFLRQREHLRLYGPSTPPACAEACALKLAA